jgi:hypothetical protein
MAPRLLPDNLVIPDSYLQDLDRNLLDSSIFPLSHHSGELGFTPNSYSKKYTPALPLPSPYPNAQMITDIRPGSQIHFRGKNVTFDPTVENNGIVEFKHYLGGKSGQFRLAVESHIKATKEKINEIGRERKEYNLPGSDVEVHMLGTGSAVPSKYRNGMYVLSKLTECPVMF